MSKTKKGIRIIAEEHWNYTEGLLSRATKLSYETVNIMKYLYIEAMVHGYKHAKEGK
jgi:hypothetical protein